MKHTENSGHIVLRPMEDYTILREHKGQVLLLLKEARPAQRWVDAACFSHKKEKEASAASIIRKPPHGNDTEKSNSVLSQNNILALSWHNAFCETHRYRRECKQERKSLFDKRSSSNNFVLHGLWPQPKKKTYCNVERRYIAADKYKQWNKLPEPDLSRETKERLRRVMPGADSNLHRHEWIKHGTCYGTDAEAYFKNAAALTEEIRKSEVARFFQAYRGKRVSIEKVRSVFDESFGDGTGEHVELRCRNGLITEIWLHIGGGDKDLGRLLKRGKTVYSRCRRGIVDKAGYGR